MSGMCNVSMVSPPASTRNDLPPKEEAAPSAESARADAILQLIMTMGPTKYVDYSATIATLLSESSSSTLPQQNEPSPISKEWQSVYGMPYEEWARYGR